MRNVAKTVASFISAGRLGSGGKRKKSRFLVIKLPVVISRALVSV